MPERTPRPSATHCSPALPADRRRAPKRQKARGIDETASRQTERVVPRAVFKRIRLLSAAAPFSFLILFLSAIMLTLLVILFSTGVFSVGLTESRIFLENELNHIAKNTKNGYGTLSVEGVALSEKIAAQIEAELGENGAIPADLKTDPALLERVLQSCVDPLMAALEKNAASAVFTILDATVNPGLPGAEGSRAGLFMRNMEPNAVNRTNPSIQYMRGPITLARERGIRVLPQWEMEFTVQPDGFFYKTLQSAANSPDPSRSYYWNPKSVLDGDYEEAMLLCVPMIASDGSVLGVCGFEVNAMLFKLQNTPYASRHKRVSPSCADQRRYAGRVRSHVCRQLR